MILNSDLCQSGFSVLFGRLIIKWVMFAVSCTRIQLDIYRQIYRHIQYIDWCEVNFSNLNVTQMQPACLIPLTCLYPCILIYLGSCALACILASLHTHILRFIFYCLYSCILISSGSCILACKVTSQKFAKLLRINSLT